jgi:hypothetical protein
MAIPILDSPTMTRLHCTENKEESSKQPNVDIRQRADKKNIEMVEKHTCFEQSITPLWGRP